MSNETEARVAAERFRADHRLGVQPLGDLVALIEQTMGIDVAVLDAPQDEHGLTMRDPVRDAVVIAVARTRRPMRQRSTLAHELGHVIFQDWADAPAGSMDERTSEEIRADTFARHLLIPQTGLREFLGERGSVDLSTVSVLAQRFLVSPQLAVIALHQGGYVDESVKQEWKALTSLGLAARFGWLDQYRALQADSERRRAPQRLLARAIQGYLAHVVSAQAIATLRGMDVRTIEEELRDAGVEPGEPPIAWSDPADLPDVHVDLSEASDSPPGGVPG